MIFNIDDYAEVKEAINMIVSNKGIAEIKLEAGNSPVVVEIKRTLKTSKKKKV